MKADDIVEGLRELRRLDPQLECFGAKAHRYELRPTLSAAEVAEVESRYGCSFPRDYREFITCVGNGGAGPDYGLYPLGYEHARREMAPWHPDAVGDLMKPFPHQAGWNLGPEFWAQEPDPPEGTPADEEDRPMEEWDRKLERHYWNRALVAGAIPVSDVGTNP